MHESCTTIVPARTCSAQGVKILTVIVTYNSVEHIARCLDTIVCSRAENEIVVFDNASSDASAAIAEAHEAVSEVVRSDRNLGFSRAVNAAATGRQFDFVLLANPDMILDPGAIDALIDAAGEHPDAGIFGGESRDTSGSTWPGAVLADHDLAHAAKFALGFGAFPFTQRFSPDVPPGGVPEGTCPVPVIAGCLMLVRGSLWEALGGMDEYFFLYGEDVDFCMRARALGHGCVFTDRSTYLHIRGASSGGHAPMMKRVLRGRRLLYRRYAHGRLGIALLMMGVANRALAETLMGRRGTWRACWSDRASWLID